MILNPTSRMLGVLGAMALPLSGCGKDEAINITPEVDAATESSNSNDDEDPTNTPDDGDEPLPDNMTPTVPVAGGPEVIGLPCEQDADCGVDGVTCLTSTSDDWQGGGPANGYCTADCTTDPDVCQALDANSACLGNEESARCVARCTAGTPLEGFSKCLNRLDLACDSISVGAGYCRPMCRNDADCGDRFCDLGTGACVDEQPEGDPVGAECDPESQEPSTCASGVCEQLGDDYAFCSGLCNLSAIGCGSTSQELVPDDPGSPICLLQTIADSGILDLGLCIQRCDCDGDCNSPDALCLQLGETEEASREAFGTVGVCVGASFQDDTPEEMRTPLGIACESRGDAGHDGGMTPLDSGAAPADSGKADSGE